jgi:hypothetical protein
MTEQQPAATAKLQTDLPLGGIRIVDVVSCIAAPVATLRLGGHGENGVEVESVVDGDPNRLMAVHSPAHANGPVDDPWHLALAKRALAVDREGGCARRIRPPGGRGAGQGGIGTEAIAALTAAGAWR